MRLIVSTAAQLAVILAATTNAQGFGGGLNFLMNLPPCAASCTPSISGDINSAAQSFCSNSAAISSAESCLSSGCSAATITSLNSAITSACSVLSTVTNIAPFATATGDFWGPNGPPSGSPWSGWSTLSNWPTGGPWASGGPFGGAWGPFSSGSAGPWTSWWGGSACPGSAWPGWTQSPWVSDPAWTSWTSCTASTLPTVITTSVSGSGVLETTYVIQVAEVAATGSSTTTAASGSKATATGAAASQTGAAAPAAGGISAEVGIIGAVFLGFMGVIGVL